MENKQPNRWDNFTEEEKLIISVCLAGSLLRMDKAKEKFNRVQVPAFKLLNEILENVDESTKAKIQQN